MMHSPDAVVCYVDHALVAQRKEHGPSGAEDPGPSPGEGASRTRARHEAWPSS